MPVQLTTDSELILGFGFDWPEGQRLRLEELYDGRILQRFPASSTRGPSIKCFAMPPTEQFVVTGNTIGELNIWDPATGLPIGEETYKPNLVRPSARKKKIRRKKKVSTKQKRSRKATRKKKKKA
jgi:hypothetical protein